MVYPTSAAAAGKRSIHEVLQGEFYAFCLSHINIVRCGLLFSSVKCLIMVQDLPDVLLALDGNTQLLKQLQVDA